MISIRWWIGMVLAVGCGGSSTPSPDAAVPPVMAAMQARGAWMEDFVWPASAYKACTSCEHVTVLEFSEDHYQLHVFMRQPGLPATAQEQCQSTMTFSAAPITGFDPTTRQALQITVGTNTCGFTPGSTNASDWQVITRDAGGAAYVAGWDNPSDPAGAFPGYDYAAMGMLAYPMFPCATAPQTLCEPSCKVPSTAGCQLPTP